MDREILFRGKRLDNGEWVEGGYAEIPAPPVCIGEPGKPTVCIVAPDSRYLPDWGLPYRMAMYEVNPSTVGQYTGLTDKNGKKIFEGDIVRYNDQMDFDIHSVVKIGKYDQDGSDGEYRAAECVGVYFEVLDFTRPDWGKEWGVNPQECNNTVSPLDNDVIGTEVIGNIHDGKEGEEA